MLATSHLPHTRHRRPRGFTLMEMVVAVSLLVIVILSVGVIFDKSSKAVSLSQASMEAFSNVRAVQYQIERDFDGLDRNGFLVIRSQLVAQSPQQDWQAGTTYSRGAHVIYSNQQYESILPNNKGNTPGPNSAYWVPSNDRADQIAFIANGSFPHRTGTVTNTPFADGTVANAALVWYGHLIVQGDPNSGFPGILAGGNQGQALVAANSPAQSFDGQNATKDLTLGRHATLLMAKNGATAGQIVVSPQVTIAAFDDPSLSTAVYAAVGGSDGTASQITASRIDAAAKTPAQVMQAIANTIGASRNGNRAEADNFCFRFRVLPSPYASDINVVNGTYRMHPILLQGAGSFAVEWTDGRSDNRGTLMWYGVGNTAAANSAPGAASVEVAAANNDLYTAIFSFDNKAYWPKAVRIRYRVTDTNDRLNGGREFTQILRVAK